MTLTLSVGWQCKDCVFVTEEFEACLGCGLLSRGCLHVRCEQCGDEMVVAFSCKGRFCPSCGGRRMTELAAQLVDRVIPDVPVRQWVLSLPWSLRYQLAFDAPLCRDVLAVFIRVVFGWLRRRAARRGIRDSHCGAVTVIQRFGGALNRIVGEFDDSALLKVFGQSGVGVFAAPSAIEAQVRQEYRVRVIGRAEEIRERFYAIALDRKLTHPAVVAVCKAARDRLFAE